MIYRKLLCGLLIITHSLMLSPAKAMQINEAEEVRVAIRQRPQENEGDCEMIRHSAIAMLGGFITYTVIESIANGPGAAIGKGLFGGGIGAFVGLIHGCCPCALIGEWGRHCPSERLARLTSLGMGVAAGMCAWSLAKLVDIEGERGSFWE